MLERAGIEDDFEAEKEKWKHELSDIKAENALLQKKVQQAIANEITSRQELEDKLAKKEATTEIELEQSSRAWTEKAQLVKEEHKMALQEVEEEVVAVENKILEAALENRNHLQSLKAEKSVEMKRLKENHERICEETRISEENKGIAMAELVKLEMEMKVKNIREANANELQATKNALQAARFEIQQREAEVQEKRDAEMVISMKEIDCKIQQLEVDDAMKIEAAKNAAEIKNKERLRIALEGVEQQRVTLETLKIEEENVTKEREREQLNVDMQKVEEQARQRVIVQAKKNIGSIIRRLVDESSKEEELRKMKNEVSRLERESRKDMERRKEQEKHLAMTGKEIEKMKLKLDTAEEQLLKASKLASVARKAVLEDEKSRFAESAKMRIQEERRIEAERVRETQEAEESNLTQKIAKNHVQEEILLRRIDVLEKEIEIIVKEPDAKEVVQEKHQQLGEAQKAIANIAQENGKLVQHLHKSRRSSLWESAAVLNLDAGAEKYTSSIIQRNKKNIEEQIGEVEMEMEVRIEKTRKETDNLLLRSLEKKNEEMDHKMRLEKAKGEMLDMQRLEAETGRRRQERQRKLNAGILAAAWDKDSEREVIHLISEVTKLADEAEGNRAAISEAKLEARQAALAVAKWEKNQEKLVADKAKVKEAIMLENKIHSEVIRAQDVLKTMAETRETHQEHLKQKYESLSKSKDEIYEKEAELVSARMEVAVLSRALAGKEDELFKLQAGLKEEKGKLLLNQQPGSSITREIEMKLMSLQGEVNEANRKLEMSKNRADNSLVILSAAEQRSLSKAEGIRELKESITEDVLSNLVGGNGILDAVNAMEKTAGKFKEESKGWEEVEEKLATLLNEKEVFMLKLERAEDSMKAADAR